LKLLYKIIQKYYNYKMEFLKPETDIITIYSKSGCSNCEKVKMLLDDENMDYTVINCDNYLLHNKSEFLQFIQKIANQECKMFPMVFYGRTFIGGFKELVAYMEVQAAFN